MPLIGVEPADGLSLERAEDLSRQLGVPLMTRDFTGTTGVKLLVTANALSLAFTDKRRGKPYAVDFLSTAWRARWQQGLAGQHIFRRALGVRDRPLDILDATAGFGQDAAMMAVMGCPVIAIEKSPVVALVLRDGLKRFEEESLQARLNLIQVVEADSMDYLSGLTAESSPDVIYIDPMFSKPKKSAKSPKEMQLLQELLPESPISDVIRLLERALEKARQRVVVKQPLKARALKAGPTHMFKGQSIRYDVYVVR
jgi:16S rRNA (guanine1516-N2)-methyltransferase